MERGVVEQVASARLELLVPCVPTRIEIAPQPRLLRSLAEQRSLPSALRFFEGPDRRHALAIEEHDGGFGVGDRKMGRAPEVEVEEDAGVGQVDLVLVVVDRAPPRLLEGRDREAVVGEAGGPALAIEARELGHHVDSHFATGITHLLDRPDEDAIGPVLGRLGSQVDLDRRVLGRRGPRSRGQHDRLHRLPNRPRRGVLGSDIARGLGGFGRFRISHLRSLGRARVDRRDRSVPAPNGRRGRPSLQHAPRAPPDPEIQHPTRIIVAF